jgi:hypothetical protein
MKLIKMTDYISQKRDIIDEEMSNEDRLTILQCIFDYSKFLKTPLKLDMFIPCDEKMNILKKPKNKSNLGSGKTDSVELLKYENKLRDYSFALSKVLFKDFHLHKDDEDNFKKCVATPGFVLPFEVLYTMKIEDIVDNDIKLTSFGLATIHQ